MQKLQNVYIRKWVDYSEKYGIGYLLSNGSIGVFFNDTSKIILDKQGVNFAYMERKKSERQDYVIHKGKLAEYPKEIKQKIFILQHFRSYLEVARKEEDYLQGAKKKSNF